MKKRPSGSEAHTLRALQTKVVRLKSLMQLSQTVNSTLDLAVLLRRVMAMAERVVWAQVSSLMLLDEATGELYYEVASGKKGRFIKKRFTLKLGQGIAGWVARHAKPLIVNNVYRDKRFFRGVDRASGFRTRSILCAPMKAKGRLVGVLEAINRKGRGGFDAEDLELFQAFADTAAIAIDNAQLHLKVLEEERMEQELSIASQIQQSFLPKTFPQAEQLQLAAKMQPAHRVGGDFYDAVMVDSDRLALVIGDVSGKGAPAALLMARVLSEFRSQVQSKSDPPLLLSTLNHSLFTERSLPIFVSLFFAILDRRSGEFTFCNAGHCAPLILSHDGKRQEWLKATGPVLGAVVSMWYPSSTIFLRPQDIMVLYTDGLLEARNRAAQTFGADRFRKSVERLRARPAAAVLSSLLEEVRTFSRGALIQDDITLMVLRFKPEGE